MTSPAERFSFGPSSWGGGATLDDDLAVGHRRVRRHVRRDLDRLELFDVAPATTPRRPLRSTASAADATATRSWWTAGAGSQATAGASSETSTWGAASPAETPSAGASTRRRARPAPSREGTTRAGARRGPPGTEAGARPGRASGTLAGSATTRSRRAAGGRPANTWRRRDRTAGERTRRSPGRRDRPPARTHRTRCTAQARRALRERHQARPDGGHLVWAWRPGPAGAPPAAPPCLRRPPQVVVCRRQDAAPRAAGWALMAERWRWRREPPRRARPGAAGRGGAAGDVPAGAAEGPAAVRAAERADSASSLAGRLTTSR